MDSTIADATPQTGRRGHAWAAPADHGVVGLIGQYWCAVGVSALIGLIACRYARRRGGRTARNIGRGISAVLALDAVVFVTHPLFGTGWSLRGSLPLNLCDVALVIAAITSWWPRWQLGFELTYFWGLAGTLQAVVTPDLTVPFPHLVFFEFVLGHVGIVVAAGYLTLGLGLAPRAGSVLRVFAITVGYTAGTGIVDWLTGGNYMYLARVPGRSSLLSVLGPWPWYIASAAAVALLLLALLDAPFRRAGHLRPTVGR